jgi:hypothetical protein
LSPDGKVETVEVDDLASTAPGKKTTVSWNAAVDRRLDQLVARARGTEPERSDLLAALVAMAPEDGAKLDQMVMRWRRSLVGEVVLDLPKNRNVVSLPTPKPGRRPKQKGDRA